MVRVRGDFIGSLDAVQVDGRLFAHGEARAKAADPVAFLKWIEPGVGNALRPTAWYMATEARYFDAEPPARRAAFLTDYVEQRWYSSNMPLDNGAQQVFTMMLHALVANAADAEPLSPKARSAAAQVQQLLGRSLFDWVRTRSEIQRAEKILAELSPADFFAVYGALRLRNKKDLFTDAYGKAAPFEEITSSKAIQLAKELGLGPKVAAQLSKYVSVFIGARDASYVQRRD